MKAGPTQIEHAQSLLRISHSIDCVNTAICCGIGTAGAICDLADQELELRHKIYGYSR